MQASATNQSLAGVVASAGATGVEGNSQLTSPENDKEATVVMEPSETGSSEGTAEQAPEATSGSAEETLEDDDDDDGSWQPRGKPDMRISGGKPPKR